MQLKDFQNTNLHNNHSKIIFKTQFHQIKNRIFRLGIQLSNYQINYPWKKCLPKNHL